MTYLPQLTFPTPPPHSFTVSLCSSTFLTSSSTAHTKHASVLSSSSTANCGQSWGCTRCVQMALRHLVGVLKMWPQEWRTLAYLHIAGMGCAGIVG